MIIKVPADKSNIDNLCHKSMNRHVVIAYLSDAIQIFRFIHTCARHV